MTTLIAVRLALFWHRILLVKAVQCILAFWVARPIPSLVTLTSLLCCCYTVWSVWAGSLALDETVALRWWCEHIFERNEIQSWSTAMQTLLKRRSKTRKRILRDRTTYIIFIIKLVASYTSPRYSRPALNIMTVIDTDARSSNFLRCLEL